MPIEVTCETRGRWELPYSGVLCLLHTFRDLFRPRPVSYTCVLVLLLSTLFAGHALHSSYKYYASIIDARLANGYLTSRPGFYAAPRTVRVGQACSREDLTSALRRAGYIETTASQAWSGSFTSSDSGIDIRPSQTSKMWKPGVVHVQFNDQYRVSELSGDGSPLDQFTLEPEVLTNDFSAKSGSRNTLSYSDIPPLMVQAILAIEDRRFFDHSGVDLFGIARALLRNAGDDRMGQGGSTITQQLIKNTYLTPSRTLSRKYAEAMLALALERRLSKQDIFALYCNEVFLGQRGAATVRGVEQAAEVYFGKKLNELTLAETATIAGMIQGPTRNSPDKHPETARTRRNIVLQAMLRDGWIGSEEAIAASDQPVSVTAVTDAHSLAPWFVDYVNRTADNQSGSSPEGQQFYTTIDVDLQRLAEISVTRQLDKLEVAHPARGAKPEAALVALDPKTGNVLAMVGGRDYAHSQLNRATDARRQPGSTFKPFVYATALEGGISPVALFNDSPQQFRYDRTKVYRPANAGSAYSMRDVTLRTGLVNSLNVVTVAVAMQSGLARTANLAAACGLPKPERFPSIALGTTEVTPLQMAAAYATFVNGGRRVEPKVFASVGEAPASHSLTDDQAQVMSPTTAYMITNMLAAVVDHGTASAARGAIKGTAIAGKTGTSRDGWFVGYTPNLVCAVWIGFDDNSQLGLSGAEAALPAWIDFIKGAVALRPELGGRRFDCPEGIEFVEIDADNGLVSTLSCPHRELIAVTEQLRPNGECYRHGNLPDLIQQDPGRIFPSPVQVQLSQQAVARAEDKLPAFDLRFITSIDVNAKGRFVLINAMR